jgi:hypothetical protein
LNTSECRSEVPGQVKNVVLEKDGEEQLGRSCEKLRCITEPRRREIYYKTIKEGMLNTLVTSCVESASKTRYCEVNLEGRTEVTTRRAMMDKEIVDDLRKR